jgi:protein TonB
MLRLRTTTGLSALALMMGVAGTGWLSTLTTRGYMPSPRVAQVPDDRAPRASPGAVHRRAPRIRHTPSQDASVVHARSYRARATDLADAGPVTLPATTPELIPLMTPADTSLSWEQLRGHLNGHVVLQVSVDGSGHVNAASVARSSGDELLDTHALRSVWRWRFAVPEGNVGGLHGEVPVRYASSRPAP